MKTINDEFKVDEDKAYVNYEWGPGHMTPIKVSTYRDIVFRHNKRRKAQKIMKDVLERVRYGWRLRDLRGIPRMEIDGYHEVRI